VPKPDGWTDEQYKQYMDDLIAEKAREAHYARIEREGFEADGDDPEAEQTCIKRTEKRRGRRLVYEPCGTKAVVVLVMRSPDNPEGLRVPLCRACLATHTRKMITLMEFFG
jgi:hypothetical protein